MCHHVFAATTLPYSPYLNKMRLIPNNLKEIWLHFGLGEGPTNLVAKRSGHIFYLKGLSFGVLLLQKLLEKCDAVAGFFSRMVWGLAWLEQTAGVVAEDDISTQRLLVLMAVGSWCCIVILLFFNVLNVPAALVVVETYGWWLMVMMIVMIIDGWWWWWCWWWWWWWYDMIWWDYDMMVWCWCKCQQMQTHNKHCKL